MLVYPKPATSQLTLVAYGLGNATVTISDLSGKVVFTTNLVKNTQALFNVSKLAGGMYVLSVADGKTTVVKKFVKE